MALTERQKELRRNHIGSSDMAAILGLDPWCNAYDIWLYKTDKIEEAPETMVMKRGKIFEPAVLSYAEEQLGKISRRNTYRVAEDNLPLASNLDASLVKTGEPVEAKTVGLFAPAKEDWGDADTDQVPDNVIIQVHVQMFCVKKGLCHVPAFIAGRGFNLFRVPYDKELAEFIVEKAIEFWDKYVKSDQPPSDIAPSLNVIKRVRRQPNKIIQIEDRIIDNWQRGKTTFNLAREAKDRTEAELIAALGDAEGGQFSDGLVTYFQQHRKSYTVKESAFRVLRIKKEKTDGKKTKK